MTNHVAAPLRTGFFLTGLCALAVTSAPAQGSQGPVVSAVDTFIVIVPARPVTEIKQDIEVLDSYRARAKARLPELKDQIRKVESQIELKEKEISLLETRQDAAEKEEKEAEVASLKTQIEGAERIRDLLKERTELYSEEIGAAEAAVDYAIVAEDMFDKEIALSKKREDLAKQSGAGGGKTFVSSGNPALLELENSVLDAHIQKLKMQEKTLSEEKDVVEQQQRIAEMQGRMLAK
jgi:hypothetical protein